MKAGIIVLALAVVLAVAPLHLQAHAAEPQAAHAVNAAATPFGTLNGLWQKWSGSPLSVHGFRAVQASEGGTSLQFAGAQLTHPDDPTALVGPSTDVTGHATFTGLAFDQYPIFMASFLDVATKHTSDVAMVQADANTVYVYPQGATVFNPPNATNVNSVWTRMGLALPSSC